MGDTVLDAAAAASSLSELGKLYIPDKWDEMNAVRLRRLSRATLNALRLLCERRPEPLPPGAALALVKLLWMSMDGFRAFLSMQAARQATHLPLYEAAVNPISAPELPQLLADACTAMAKAISSSSSSSTRRDSRSSSRRRGSGSGSGSARRQAASTASSTRLLQQDDFSALLAMLLEMFAVLANVDTISGAVSSDGFSSSTSSHDSSARAAQSTLMAAGLVAAGVAASELALAVLRSPALASDATAHPISAARRMLLPVLAAARQPLCVFALDLCAPLARVTDTFSGSQLHECPAAAEAAVAAVAALASADSVQQLALLHLALAARCFHQQQQGAAQDGAASARRRQTAVPACQALLQALGATGGLLSGDFPGLPLFERLSEDGTPIALYNTLTMLETLTLAATSSSQAAADAASAAEQAAGDPGLSGSFGLTCHAVGALVECSVLLADTDWALDGVAACTKHLLLRAQRRWEDGGGELDTSALQQAQQLLQTLLTTLLPAVQRQRRAGGDGAADAEAALADAVLLLTLILVQQQCLDSLGDLVEADLPGYFRLLQAGLRAAAASSPAWCLRVATSIPEVGVHTFRGSDPRVVEARSTSAGDDVLLPIFGLMLTCMKVSSRFANQDTLMRATSAAMIALDQALFHCLRAAQPGGPPRSCRPWCGLAGRCLVSMGRSVERAIHDPATTQDGSISISVTLHDDYQGSPDLAPQKYALQRAGRFVIWLLQNILPDEAAWAAVSGPAANTAARLQLLEDAQQLMQLMQGAAEAWEAAKAGQRRARSQRQPQQQSDWQVMAAAMGLPLAQEMQAFGAALCAQLPGGRVCCSYHGCANLGKQSEVQLITVCSGCKTAHYCSMHCQAAHWKNWHRPVCKRIKQQQSAAQQRE